MKESILVLIPVYNEEKNILSQIVNLQKVLDSLCSNYKIIISDDGSNDNTENILTAREQKDNSLDYIRYPFHKGIGLTLHRGLLYAIHKYPNAKYIVTLDGDNTCDINLIPKMISFNKKGYNVVIASRYEKGGEFIGGDILRKNLSKSINIILKLFFKYSINDYTILFRSYEIEAIRYIVQKYGSKFVHSEGFSISPEILLKLNLLEKEMRLKELPHHYNLNARKDESKMKVIPTIINYIIFLFKNLKYAKIKKVM